MYAAGDSMRSYVQTSCSSPRPAYLLAWASARQSLSVLSNAPQARSLIIFVSNRERKESNMSNSAKPISSAALLIVAAFLVATNEATSKEDAAAGDGTGTIAVRYENYNQAESARNFNYWAKLGGNNTMLHLKELSPVGPGAPTIRMNLNTLYSVGVGARSPPTIDTFGSKSVAPTKRVSVAGSVIMNRTAPAVPPPR
jgi:hypothetical protein